MADPFDDPRWDEFVQQARERSLAPMMQSAMFMHLASKRVRTVDDLDVRYCLELGAMLLLDKPIIVVAPPDAYVPDALRNAAATVVECDVDTHEGREAVAAAVADLAAG